MKLFIKKILHDTEYTSSFHSFCKLCNIKTKKEFNHESKRFMAYLDLESLKELNEAFNNYKKTARLRTVYTKQGRIIDIVIEKINQAFNDLKQEN